MSGAEPSDATLDAWLREALEDSAAPSSDEPPSALKCGEVLADRFSVHGLIRRGGMGAIYRGVDLLDSRPIAIKTLGYLGSSEQHRFLREARILGELEHPGIVRHIAHGATPRGTLYLVMEWLQGEDLAERLVRQPLALTDTLSILRRVCEALALVHSRGVVHRDLKPANLFLNGGVPADVKLLDFGVALDGEAVHSLTQTGALLGTVGYMSPEQARGDDDIDQRSDIFALGCVLYQCLTRRAPFTSRHAIGVLAKVLHEQPARPSDLVEGMDPRLDGLVARLLAKDRNERLPSARAVLAELESFSFGGAGDSASRRSQRVIGGAEQRVVSVIFGKLRRGVGEASRAADADAASELLAGVSSRFGAQVATLKGGALLLISSGQREANDRAAQAVVCALELQRQRDDLSFAVSTGLAQTSLPVPVGACIDAAAALLERIQQPGVFVDEVTLGLIGLRFEIDRIGALHRVVGARRDIDASHLLMGRSTPHVGRERELRTLDGVLDECVNESVSRMVFVTGPPGIGKSRLVSEWLARSGRGGTVRALFGRAEPNLPQSALSLVQRLLRDAMGVRDSDDAHVQYQAIVRRLAPSPEGRNAGQLVEFCAELLGISSVVEPSPILLAARATPEIMQEQTRRALHGWLDIETARQPVVVVLEDLHWADLPSVDFWSGATRDNPNRPLMILALARPEAAKNFHAMSEGIAVHLRLLGLSPRAAKQLVAFALERPIAPELLSRVIQTADGNPFILEELIRRVASGSVDWPDTVMAMVQSRIERLGPEARRVLRAASVFGERCWDTGVDEVIGGGADAGTLLRSLADDELLIAAAESRYAHTREYRFRHALLRDAAYAMLTSDDRRVAHTIAADWLDRNQEKDATVFADHYQRAGLAECALPWLVRAAKVAIDAGDTKTTIDLANRGVDLGAGGVQRGHLLLLRSYAEALAGSFDVPATREAVDLLPIGSAPWWLGLAVLIFGASIGGHPGQADPYVKIAADAPFTKDNEVPLGQCLQTLVGGLVLLGRSDVAEAILARAVLATTADSAPDPIFGAFLESARCALAAVMPLGGKWCLETAYLDGKRCVETLGVVGAVHGQMVAEYFLSVAAMHLGLYAEAAKSCRRSIELAERRINGLKDAWPWLFLAKAQLRLGEIEPALQTLTVLEEWNDWTVQQMIPVLRGEALLRRGNLDEAVRMVRPACSGVSPRLCRLAACVLARAQLLLDLPKDALRTAVEALTLSATNRGLESDVDLLTLHAEALFALGRNEEANEAATVARAFVDNIAKDIGDAELRRSFTERVEPCARALGLPRAST
ncbi:MAG TPA: protein kinase [Polyangiaceae bacterium]|nr:protein kinase [Polyangiaceae bacterium]